MRKEQFEEFSFWEVVSIMDGRNDDEVKTQSKIIRFAGGFVEGE